MAQETLKITITADNKEAVANINQTITATNNLGNAMRQIPQSSGAATNALTNLSRVAQDAPYGFIGIANNLNPLLESFQRLQKETGSSANALKAMAGGLMGPAGIGLALGAVSSLLVAFGPKIANFVKGVDSAKEAEDKFAESLDKARASASESGLKLLAYIGIAENAAIADDKRANALKFVISELAKVNSAYASTIKTTDQARAAVDLYTKALIAQAITSRYIDEIADKTIKLESANKKALAAAEEYNKTLERSKNMSNGYTDASIVQAGTINRTREEYIGAAQEAVNLSNSIDDLNKSVQSVITTAAINPFYNITNGAKQLAAETGKAAANIQKIGGVTANAPTGFQQPVQTITPSPIAPLGEAGVGFQGAPSQDIIDAKLTSEAIGQLDLLNATMGLTAELTDAVSFGFNNIFEALVNGENIGVALEQTFKQIVVQLIEMVAKALIFKTILSALGVGVGLPTDMLNASSFGQGGGLLGEFILKGSDLVLATQRANNNLSFRR
jgi:uncharacterized protein YoxC